MPKLASSCVSENMPTLPLYFGFHRSARLLIGSEILSGSQAMPVIPDAHGTL